jgi:hypothetical protein
MKSNGLVGSVVACTVVTALAVTFLVEGGWRVLPPVLLALYVVAGVSKALPR